MKNLSRYIEFTNWIKELSSPQARDIANADAYRATLLRNFSRIGELSLVNTELLNEHYYPLIRSEEALSDEDIASLREFSNALVDPFELENLDLPMVYLQAQRLVQDAEQKDDPAVLIRALDDLVIATYGIMDMTMRLVPCNNSCYVYRDRGFDAIFRILEWLDKDKFASLPDEETKILVLINARYIHILCDRSDTPGDDELNERDLSYLRTALALCDDPFYREQVPSYDWRYHEFRTLEYICDMTYYNNERAFNEAHLKEIYDYTNRWIALWESDEEYFSGLYRREVMELYLLRNAYLANEISKGDCKKGLVKLYKKRAENNFSYQETSLTLHAPWEYILLLDEDNISKTEQKTLNEFYQHLITYMHRLPKSGNLSFRLTFFARILKKYRELEGGMDFETFGLSLMAALHPPTYVHTLSVAAFAKGLATHLIRKQPELFTGMPGCDTKEDVLKDADAIADYTYHAALCHDFGKLMIIDTIMTYGRPLLDMEMDIIRTHPAIGAYMLERFEGTRPYAPVAHGHHRWYNGKGGYPDDFDMEHSPYRTVLAIVACADCLDASTDTVGRSYKEGKTFDHFLSEVHAGNGTRYAPYMAELLADMDVRADMEMLLAKGRDENYREAYRLLSRYQS